MVEVSQDKLDRITALLGEVKDADKKVLRPALARGLTAGRTAAAKEVTRVYHIRQTDFKSRGKIKVNAVTATTSDVVGSIAYAGQPIPLIKFKVNPKWPTHGKAPSAAVLKANSAVKFVQHKDTFVAAMKNGHIGIFQRTGAQGIKSRLSTYGANKHTEKLKELMSPSTPQMVGKTEVMDKVEERVQEIIDKRIEHEIERIINKY